MNSSVQHKGPRNFYIVAARFGTAAARRAGTGRRPHAPCERLRLPQAERRAAPEAPP